MNETQANEILPEKVNAQEVVTFQSHLFIPDDYILIVPSATESKYHACGEMRLRRFAGSEKIKKATKRVVTEHCYDLEPGGECELKINFYQGRKKVKPKGMLLLQTKRGKLSPTRYELDGSRDKVVVKYKAPDETIKVSIRAYLDGFHRGKIHLHLEE